MAYKLKISASIIFILFANLRKTLVNAKGLKSTVAPFEKWDRWVSQSYLERHRNILAYYENEENSFTNYTKAWKRKFNEKKRYFARKNDDSYKHNIFHRQNVDSSNETGDDYFETESTPMPTVNELFQNPEDWLFLKKTHIEPVVYERFQPDDQMLIHTLIEFGDCHLWNLEYEKESTIYISPSLYLSQIVLRPVYKQVVRSRYDDYLYSPEDKMDQFPACIIGLMWTYEDYRLEDYKNNLYICNGVIRFIFDGRTYDFYYVEIWIPDDNYFAPVLELQIYKPYITVTKHQDQD